MFPKRISVTFFTTYVLISNIRSDCSKLINENEKINFNFNLSAAVNFIIQSLNSTNIRAVGCNGHFQNDFNDLSEHWRTNITLTLLNVDRKYVVRRKKIPKNDVILMFMDRQFARGLQHFMENIGVQIRKHKIVVIFQTENCDNNGFLLLPKRLIKLRNFTGFLFRVAGH